MKAKILPELDDDLPSTVGTEHESLEELQTAIRENLSAREEHERRVAHEEKVVDSVVEQATLDLPPQLVEDEAGPPRSAARAEPGAPGHPDCRAIYVSHKRRKNSSGPR